MIKLYGVNLYITEEFSINNKRYQVDDYLGSGGNAIVYSITDAITGERYAIKILKWTSKKAVSRFIQEIELLNSFEDIHIMNIYDSGMLEIYSRKDGCCPIKTYCYLMPLAEKNLKEYIMENEYLNYNEYIPQILGLSNALAVIHTSALHRDIKPENILVIGDTWVLSDFGLCKYLEEEYNQELTQDPEKPLGPKFWMSPESINKIYNPDIEISTYSDVFQLCNVFWYIVNKKNSLGIVTEEDWRGPTFLFEVIYQALQHNEGRRIQDGNTLYDKIVECHNNNLG